MKVSVIIPNWNGRRFLAGCLDSLGEQSWGDLEVIVVDNGSQDGSLELIRDSWAHVRLISLAENRGFSKAVNAGIRASSAPFVALLNNDTVVDRDWLVYLVAALERHRQAGSAASKMLSWGDKAILDGAGDGYRRGGLPGRIGHRERDCGQFDDERYILGACGGAALYRRSMLDDIGLFDEHFFAYLEDVDLALRAQASGYKCIYVPEAIVYHLGCGTTGSGFHPMVVRLSAQNNWNTIVKNIPGRLLFKFLPQIAYWQAFYLAAVILRGGPGNALAWLAGTFNALRLLPSMLAARRQIKLKRRVPVSYLERIILESELDLVASHERLAVKGSKEVSPESVAKTSRDFHLGGLQ